MTQLEDIAKKLSNSIQFIDIVEGETSTTIYYPHKKILQKNYVGFRREAISIIQSCTDQILDINHPKFGPLFNSLDNEYVYDFLIELTSDIRERNNSEGYDLFLKELEIFINNLKMFTFHTYVKIGMLKTQKIHDFSIIKIFPNDESFWKKITEGKNEKITQKIIKDFQKNSHVFTTIFDLQINALDEKQAKVKTLQKIADILNIFKFFGAKGVIREGEAPITFHEIYIKNLDTGFDYHNEQIENIGKFGKPFDLDLFEMQHPHIIEKLKVCFDPERANLLERKILTSLTWFGESIYEDHPSHQLLKLIISLEALLIDSSERGSKNKILQERAAFLLGNNEEVRQWFSDTIKEAYIVRNSIVHNGDKYPIPLKLIKRLIMTVHDLNVLFLTSKKIKNFEDIIFEVQNRKNKSNS
jgi:hypothetical protein